MRILVLGGGLLGIASAWYLAEDGHEVTVIERQPGAGLETSFANGGQISTSHAVPWAHPGAPIQILKWLGRSDAPLLWRWRADAAQWSWGLRFLAECTPGRTRRNIGAILALALYSREQRRLLLAEQGIEHDRLMRGILHFYTDPREFERTIPQAALMREFGCERQVKTAAECLALEPALAESRIPIVGGTFTAGDESGDAHGFTRMLARRCAGHGVRFRYGESIAALDMAGGRVTGIRLAGGETLVADAYVAALGSHTPLLLKPLGMRLPVVPAKGYSATIPLGEGSIAPTVSLTDDAHKIVISRLGSRLRVAGTAEFAGYDTTVDARRCRAIMRRVLALFPNLPSEGIEYWAGLRPATPGNVPFVGRSPMENLFLNTGHGTLGWTMACGSGCLLADLVAGRAPDVDPVPYAFD